MNSSLDFTGTGVALVTPFTDQGKVDHHALAALVEHVITGGVNTLVALGTTAETATLSQAEQYEVLDTIFSQNKGRLPIVIGAGSNHTAAVIEKAHDFSSRYDLAGLLLVSPYYNKPTQAGMYAHFAAIAEAVEVPIILYNVPGRTAANMQAETTLKLAAAFSHIVAIKEASGDLDQCMALVQGAKALTRETPFRVLSGDDSLTVAQIAIGMDGVTSVAANAFPGPFSDMVQCALKGDFQGARTLHYQLLNLMNLHFKEGNPAGVKMSLSLQGVCKPYVRLPLVVASASLKESITDAYLSFSKYTTHA